MRSSYTLSLSALALAAALFLKYLVFPYLPSAALSLKLLLSLSLFFFITTALVHFFMIKSAKGNPKQFVRTFMAATGIKMAAYLLVIIAYAVTHKAQAFAFIISFAFLYFIFTVFEVLQLKKSLGTHS